MVRPQRRTLPTTFSKTIDLKWAIFDVVKAKLEQKKFSMQFIRLFSDKLYNLIQQSKKDIKTDAECCVCWETVASCGDVQLVKLECNHTICKECLNQIHKTECPMCRAKLKKLEPKLRKKILGNGSKANRYQYIEDFNRVIEEMGDEIFITFLI
jgi:hypothetical protein